MILFVISFSDRTYKNTFINILCIKINIYFIKRYLLLIVLLFIYFIFIIIYYQCSNVLYNDKYLYIP